MREIDGLGDEHMVGIILVQDFTGGLLARLHRVRTALRQRAGRIVAYRRLLREMEAMSESELAEFGLHRSDLPRIARAELGRS